MVEINDQPKNLSNDSPTSTPFTSTNNTDDDRTWSHPVDFTTTDAANDDIEEVEENIDKPKLSSHLLVQLYRILFIILGTCIGVLSRLYIEESCDQLISPLTQYPLSTTIANVCGCILIALFSHYINQRQHNKQYNTYIKLFCVTGICGSLTTFSQYMTDIYNLIHNPGTWNTIWIVVIYMIVINIICIGLCAVGFIVAQLLTHKQDDSK